MIASTSADDCERLHLSPSQAPERMDIERAARLSPLQKVAEMAHKVKDFVKEVAHDLARAVRHEQTMRHQQAQRQEHERAYERGPRMGMSR